MRSIRQERKKTNYRVLRVNLTRVTTERARCAPDVPMSFPKNTRVSRVPKVPKVLASNRQCSLTPSSTDMPDFALPLHGKKYFPLICCPQSVYMTHVRAAAASIPSSKRVGYSSRLEGMLNSWEVSHLALINVPPLLLYGVVLLLPECNFFFLLLSLISVCLFRDNGK